MDKRIQINPLPVLTWNKLKLNSTELVYEAVEGGKPSHDPVLPEGIKYLETLDAVALSQWLVQHGATYEEEEIVAGKYPMAVAGCGLGEEADAAFAAAGTRLYEIEGQGRQLRFELNASHEHAALDSRLILLKKESEAELSFLIKAEEERGFLGLRLYVVLEEGAKLKLSLLQRLPQAYVFVCAAGAWLANDSELEYTALQLGSNEVYAAAYFDQKGKESRLRSDFGCLGLKDQRYDLNYVDCFRGKNTEGVMRFYGVLMDNAQKLFRETLDFRKGCVGAEGDEEEDFLVLGSEAVNRAIPMILCEEENMSGRHAASGGRLSTDMLFYMQSRGLSEKTAEELMIRSRIGRVAGRFTDDKLKEETEEYLDSLFT